MAENDNNQDGANSSRTEETPQGASGVHTHSVLRDILYSDLYITASVPQESWALRLADIAF